jgi:hypothetical protein
MAFQISDFTTRLKGDGARPNLFQVSMSGIPISGAPDKLQFMAKSAQLPGSTLGIVPMYYFGREMKFAGNRTFADWTITIINDEDFLIRNSFESWMNSINTHETNVRTTVGGVASAGGQANIPYTLDALVYQYGKGGPSGDAAKVIKAYNFVGMFPVDLSPIDLDWGTNDAIEEFTVTFAYQYWTTGTDGKTTGITT